MPRNVDHAERRAEIVLGLWGVIHERGLEGVTFRAVAESAGVSVGRIQHYFASKDELVREGCTRIVAAARKGHESRTAHSGAAPSLRDLVASPIPRSESERLGAAVWYAYLARSASDPRIAEIVAAALEDSRRRAARLVEELRGPRRPEHPEADPGEARRGELEQEALTLLAVGEGLAQRTTLGTLAVEDALLVVDEELARRGLTP